jgi:hypothetical protein
VPNASVTGFTVCGPKTKRVSGKIWDVFPDFGDSFEAAEKGAYE